MNSTNFKSKLLYLLVMLLIQNYIFSQTKLFPVREVLSLDKGWSFHLGDFIEASNKGHNESYNNAKTGQSKGAAAPDFDDSDWRIVNLPHDWSVESVFDSTLNLAQGYRVRGIGWYRRSFNLNKDARGKSFELQFDGISTYATIWINGILIHRNWCGYTSSYIDITPFLKYGEENNTIAVRVDARSEEGWFYEGAGIYRHTWLIITNPIHISTDGVYANPINELNKDWKIPVEVSVENNGNQNTNIELSAELLDPSGKQIAINTNNFILNSFNQNTISVPLKVNNPHLWSVDQPTLYKVKIILKKEGEIIDEVINTCGFRTIRFSSEYGFFLNEENLKIKGTCNHQDHAGVGVAVPDALLDFRIKTLKSMGSNAYRCAHNPPSKELLDACDRLGMLVLDENRNFNSAPEFQKQLEWMVKRDRNHPSIILWNISNEETLQGSEIGFKIAQRMKAFITKLDVTRPVTAAMNDGLTTPVNVSQAVDVVGFNYFFGDYDKFHKINPSLPLISTEDVSQISQRGIYKTDKKNHLLADYDTEKPDWGNTHRIWWKAIDQRPFMAGCFVWTGFDYRGEPTPYEWPTVNSNFGILDICGFPKTPFYIHQAFWLKKPILKLIPHWNWPNDSIGKPIKVMAITNVDSIELFLNGKLIDAKKPDKYEMGEWQVPYYPGILLAKGYKNGKLIISDKVETTGFPVALKLISYRKSIYGNGQDAMPITIQAIDDKGRVVPNANFMVEIEINGPAKNIGVGNGNPNCHESEKSNQHSLFNGLAQLIIQSNENSKGLVNIKASAIGMKDANLEILVKDSFKIPSVNVLSNMMFINKWISSPTAIIRLDPLVKIPDFDMNSWVVANTGLLKEVEKDHYVIWRSKIIPSAEIQKNGGTVLFKQTTGVLEIWVDGVMLKSKGNSEKEDIKLNIPPKKGEITISILMKEFKNKIGIGGVTTITEKEI